MNLPAARARMHKGMYGIQAATRMQVQGTCRYRQAACTSPGEACPLGFLAAHFEGTPDVPDCGISNFMEIR
jgi:hypothetical protein